VLLGYLFVVFVLEEWFLSHYLFEMFLELGLIELFFLGVGVEDEGGEEVEELL
jgi:hypothetical protein